MNSWTGTLSRTDAITGHLLCTLTGWRLNLTGTADGARTIYLTGAFAGELFGEEAPPWSEEADLARPHIAKAPPYDCHWTGTIRSDGSAWFGEFDDCFGGRLRISGKIKGPGHIVLTAEAVDRRVMA